MKVIDMTIASKEEINERLEQRLEKAISDRVNAE